ncbi:MAG: hypothetical protein M0Z38_10910 [Deltaproteobacteria bacterium]|nr:hypothetical protein [Deltaproteobacteria bacterium]
MKTPSAKPRKWSAAADRAREELLRPCPYLGYNHDRIGVHCLAKDALAIAENSFRRAIWLNPYEPRFVLHLAHALFRLKRYQEALEALDELDFKWAEFKQGDELRATIISVTRGSSGRKD